MVRNVAARYTFRELTCLRTAMLVWSTAALLLISALPSRAATSSVPWECSTYEGDAQTRCLNTFIELQREKIAQLEGQLQAQQTAVNQLKDQVDRQTAASADLQRQLSDRPIVNIAPPLYPLTPYVNLYPQLGVGLYFGNPWIYGPFPYYQPFWGPRYYRPWGHHR